MSAQTKAFTTATRRNENTKQEKGRIASRERKERHKTRGSSIEIEKEGIEGHGLKLKLKLRPVAPANARGAMDELHTERGKE